MKDLRGNDYIDSRDVVNRLEELERDLDDLRHEAQEAQDTLDAARREVDEVQAALDEARGVEGGEGWIDEIQKALDAGRAALDAAQNTLTDAEAALDEAENDAHEEMHALRELVRQGEGEVSGWDSGETLIREDYFVEYAQQLADDLGTIDRNASWPLNHIDWDAAADDLRSDYTELTFAGETYLARA